MVWMGAQGQVSGRHGPPGGERQRRRVWGGRRVEVGMGVWEEWEGWGRCRRDGVAGMSGRGGGRRVGMGLVGLGKGRVKGQGLRGRVGMGVGRRRGGRLGRGR